MKNIKILLWCGVIKKPIWMDKNEWLIHKYILCMFVCIYSTLNC